MFSVTSTIGGLDMARKIYKTICGIVCFSGFMLLLGTAGASDLNQIGFPQIIWQSALGLAMFAGGGYLGGYMV